MIVLQYSGMVLSRVILKGSSVILEHIVVVLQPTGVVWQCISVVLHSNTIIRKSPSVVSHLIYTIVLHQTRFTRQWRIVQPTGQPVRGSLRIDSLFDVTAVRTMSQRVLRFGRFVERRSHSQQGEVIETLPILLRNFFFVFQFQFLLEFFVAVVRFV